MRYYNGFTEQEIASSDGLLKLGIEQVKPLVTRGHLVDVAGLKGRTLNAGEEITLADIRAALSRQGLREADIRQGDAILFHTGWGQLWMKDNAKYSASEPGIGLEVARWVAERGLCLTGADSWSVEVVPNPDASLAYPVHARAADQERDLQPREPDLRRAAGRSEVPVHVRVRARADQGRHRLARLSDCDHLRARECGIACACRRLGPLASLRSREDGNDARQERLSVQALRIRRTA